jgi:hypothetical protein
MSEHHPGPWRGPISGLPGFVVATFSLFLAAWMTSMILPLWVAIIVVAAGIGFFFALRLPGRR